MWFIQGIISFGDSNLDIENYSFLVHVKFLLTRILDSNWIKLDLNFCITVNCFHARAQSSTWTTYRKCVRESIMAESGIGPLAAVSSATVPSTTFCLPATSTSDLRYVNFKKYEQRHPHIIYSATENCKTRWKLRWD